MSRLLELALCALVPLVISAFSAPRDITPDDELNAISETRMVDDDDLGVAGLVSERGRTVEDHDRSA